MKKKFLSGLLTLTLAVGLCAPASLAADTELNGTKMTDNITISSTLNLPTLSVTIAPAANMVVNPYGLSYTLTGGGTNSDTLITAPALITNNSDVNVDVGAVVTGAVQGDAQFSESDTFTGATSPKVYMKFAMANLADDDKVGEFKGANDATNGISGMVETTAISTTASGRVFISLDKKTTGSPDTPTYGVYRIMGKSGGTGWETADKISVTVAFDIAPSANQSFGGTT